MDEILVYLVSAEKIKEGDWSLRGSTLAFLQQLTIAVAKCPHAVLVATLNDQLLERLDPALLIGKRWSLWPDDGRMVNAKAPGGYFTQLTHLCEARLRRSSWTKQKPPT